MNNTYPIYCSQDLIARRNEHRKLREWAHADAIRTELYAVHSIVVDDDNESWRVVEKEGLPEHFDTNGCLAWVKSKQVVAGIRPGAHCGAAKSPGSWFYCATHAKTEHGRVPCPRGLHHSIPMSNLNSHLRVCCGGVPSHTTVDLSESAAHICPNCNANDGEEEVPGEMALPPLLERFDAVALTEASRDVHLLQTLASRITAALVTCGACGRQWDPENREDTMVDGNTLILDKIGLKPLAYCNGLTLVPKDRAISLEAKVKQASASKKSRNSANDVMQQVSLAGLLLYSHHRDCHAEETTPAGEQVGCVVEFCAGSAKLSGIVRQVSQQTWPSVLVDKAPFKTSPDATNTIRVTTDIKDLRLSKVKQVADAIESEHTVGATGKHLCGVATDLALRCCLGCQQDRPEVALNVAFAVCCHHL